jgi:hypothetical protein
MKYQVIFYDDYSDVPYTLQTFNSKSDAENWADSHEYDYEDEVYDPVTQDYKFEKIYKYHNPEDKESYNGYEVKTVNESKMENKLHESLRKIIQQEIAAALQEASTQTYSLEITAKNGKKTISKVPAESPVELNRIVTALKKSKNVSGVKVLKVEGSVNEDSSQFKVGEIYRDKSGVEYQVSPMPDKFKGKWGADTLNVWVTNLDTDEKHFMPVTMLKDLKQVYVTPTAGRKMLGRFESVNEADSNTYTYAHDPKSNKYNVIKVSDGAAVTSFSTEAQAKSHVEKINKLSKGYAKIKGNVYEGPEEMGAYRRLVVTSPLMDKIKAEYTKFMARPEVKTMYPVRFKMIDSPKPDTFVVDVEGDKATVVAIKLSDLAKKLDKSVAIMVRKERKLK